MLSSPTRTCSVKEQQIRLTDQKKQQTNQLSTMPSWTKAVSTSTAERYLSAPAELRAAPAPRFVLFLGIDPSTKTLWCPDVRRCAPAVRKACEKASLLEVDVGGRDVWRGKTPHPFRAAPLSLTGIPTLLAVDGEGKEIGRVGSELEATGSEEEAAAVAGAFVEKFRS